MASAILLCLLALLPAVDTACKIYPNGGCYSYIPTPMGFYQAEATCVSQGGHLASFHSQYDSEMLDKAQYDNGGSGVYWVGLHRLVTNGVYTWNYTDGSPFNYQPWSYYGETSGDCVLEGEKIFGTNCSDPLPAVCGFSTSG